MIKPPPIANESQRLSELVSLELLDSPNEPEFDEVVSLAAYITGCPISLISLVDSDRQWFKAKVGLEAQETSRDISFCGHAIHKDDLFIVENALNDDRFNKNPLVTEDPSIRFYAGQPLITESGHRIGTLCTIDRVPRKLSEEQLTHLAALGRQVIKLIECRMAKRRHELQSMTKNQFLAHVSHEIRTPLTGIMGYAAVASEALQEPSLSGKVHDYIKNINRHSKHILSIVGNILDLSKIESGRVELDLANFSVNELKEHVLSLFELEAKKKNILIKVDIDPEVPKFLNSDFMRLKQILINLVGNAIKFTAKGEVKVRISFEESNLMLKMKVEDTGCGLSKEQSARLFNPFMQGDVNVQSRYGGTGLGLALSRKIAQSLHGDVVLLDSQPGKGSLFEARVRVALMSKEEASEIPKSTAMRSTLQNIGSLANILVVDDSEDTRFIFNHFLKQFSMTADEAEDGQSTLDLVSKNNYDVVFLDLQLPDQDGFAVLKKIREMKNRIKVVAFTAHTMKEAQAKYANAGFDAFLPKPFTVNQIAEVLFETLVYAN